MSPAHLRQFFEKMNTGIQRSLEIIRLIGGRGSGESTNVEWVFSDPQLGTGMIQPSIRSIVQEKSTLWTRV